MPYSVTPTSLPDVLLLTPKVFEDERGFFFESFNARDFEAATGLKRSFVQDNHSRSSRGVLRGMHYQIRHPQEKLVRVIAGAVFDVAVDLRDAALAIDWPLLSEARLASRDRDGMLLADAETFGGPAVGTGSNGPVPGVAAPK